MLCSRALLVTHLKIALCTFHTKLPTYPFPLSFPLATVSLVLEVRVSVSVEQVHGVSFLFLDSTYKGCHVTFLLLCLTYFTQMTFSGSVYVAANGLIFNNWIILHCIYVMFNLLLMYVLRGEYIGLSLENMQLRTKMSDSWDFMGTWSQREELRQCDGGQLCNQVLHGNRLQTLSCLHLFPRLVTASLSIYTENSGKDWKPHESVLLFLIFTLCWALRRLEQGHSISLHVNSHIFTFVLYQT